LLVGQFLASDVSPDHFLPTGCLSLGEGRRMVGARASRRNPGLQADFPQDGEGVDF
jgi:hypothetical protein